MKDWVLEDFDPAEEAVVAPAVANAVEVIDAVLMNGLEAAMNRFNAPVLDATGDQEVST
jgi:peptidyl-tRNA hydrolase